jgi:DUF971 family protein
VNADLSQKASQPLEITQVGRERLCVRWGDGHESAYPLAYLRRLCRCAACRASGPEKTAPTSASAFRVLGPEPSAVPALLEPVGNYALGVHWKDRHHSIFAFDSLRQDCPCGACAADRTPSS